MDSMFGSWGFHTLSLGVVVKVRPSHHVRWWSVKYKLGTQRDPNPTRYPLLDRPFLGPGLLRRFDPTSEMADFEGGLALLPVWDIVST